VNTYYKKGANNTVKYVENSRLPGGHTQLSASVYAADAARLNLADSLATVCTDV